MNAQDDNGRTATGPNQVVVPPTPASDTGHGLGPIGQQALLAARTGPITVTVPLEPSWPSSSARLADLEEPLVPKLASPDFDFQWAGFEKFARATFEDDLLRARAKAGEYGSHDLEIMGTSMEALLPDGGLDSQSRHAAGIEMAIAFYLMGKAARMFGAFQKGRTPGPDSWRDGSIYSMMARYVRVNGRWIG